MAVFTVQCQGRQWQSDFTPLVPRLYTYFSKCFWRDKRDYEELRQRAVIYFMHRFMRQWKPGGTVRIATIFIVWHARAGRCGIVHQPRPYHISVRARNVSHKAMARWRAKADPVASRLHFKDALAQLSEKERSIVQMYLARYTWAEITQGLGVSDYYIKAALRRVCDLLNR